MTFDEVLTQIIDLLKRQGRVSYSALKRRFDLNDDYLNDLKDELLYVYPVRDDDGRGLIWTGETASVQESASPLAQTIQQPAAQQQPSSQITPLSTVPPPDAERRQLTVMFCDLVDSTTLSSQLDPEDYRDVVRAYQTACTEVIQRYEGHIAQLLGDGLLVYFGYPQAHEDDAHRAVRTGLGILAAMGDLNKGLQQAKGIQLAIRIGIHTGLVVIGDMGGAGRQEQLALGEVPNIASRIEGLAAPNTVAISEATLRLVQGYFECQALGAQTLRGVTEPLQMYRVLQDSGARGRLDVAVTRGLTPLVGREAEVTLLLERWEQAKSGQGQVVLLSGDAGIGKSRLVQMLKEHVANEPHTRWECRSSSYFENTALFPLTDLFQRLLRFQAKDTPDEKVGKLEQMLSQYRLPVEESVPLLALLLSLALPEHRYPPLNLSPQRQRQKTLETIGALLVEQAEQHPVLFIVEDLHWTDPTTLELLGLLLDQTPTASLLVLLTCRPHFQPAWHHRSYLTEMTLNHLSPTQVEQIITRITDGKTLPQEVLAQIVEKTDGVPLFVEEMTKAILESGQLKALDGHYELVGSLRALTIPATLQDSLMSRLDRLMTGKVIAQLGATIGRQFSYALLQGVAQLNERTLQEELHRLVEAELLYQRGLPPQAIYTFKHALIQDAAYESLLKSTRQHYHQRIAQVLEERFPETTQTQPELLAHHCTEAGLIEQAVGYWHNAGQKALQRSAHTEAIAHLNKGLAQLATLPDTTARTQQELGIQLTLGRGLIAVQGYAAPEVGHAYTRAWALCQQLGETLQTTESLWGLGTFHAVRRELLTAYDLGKQCLASAQRLSDIAGLIGAQQLLGFTLGNLGDFRASRAHLEQGIALYQPRQHPTLITRYAQDTGINCYNYVTQTLWVLGYPNQALARRREMVAIAQEWAHPYSVGVTLFWAARLHFCRREVAEMLTLVDALMHLAAEQGFTFLLALGMVLQGWALTTGGRIEEGIRDMRQGIASTRAARSQMPYQLALLAEAYVKVGDSEEGLRLVEEALAGMDKTGERHWAVEIHRIKGELLLVQSMDNHTVAASCFQQAIAIAQSQQAKSFELRTATSLAQLWQSQGKRDEARQVLAEVYNWFTEGFDTADLKDAKALLDALA